ncbi:MULTISPECIES: SH3 domain-containing protein [Roseobacteraceae]|nr:MULTISPECIES: SH3 domain-containing protein [Roseobacteraceae]MBT3140225.1 SH3 domain-containing protein [Falsiruegeria litorea]MBT8169016.1 SH3 domain-containing protein [Falsiruegeria litorea]
MRFVLLSFAVLSFAFYELSGGADFEPRGVRPPKPERIAQPQKTNTDSISTQIVATTLVAKPAIARRKAPVVKTPEPKPELTAEQEAAGLAQISASLATNGTVFQPTATQTFSLASLEQGAASITAVEPTEPAAGTPAPEYVEPKPDIREVMGTRVNMRDGPGTIYPVVARLNIGHQVEVLSESGTGWLRLRVLPERQTGWVAASLITKKTR